MAREGLRLELDAALRDTSARKKERRIGRLRVAGKDGARLVNLTVRPVQAPGAADGTAMVLFEDAGAEQEPEQDAAGPLSADEAGNLRSDLLEQELKSTREVLQSANEELETSNEELSSTVEELQSTNEELMTSQEELRSVNEELLTVNAELEDKVQQLDATNNDLENLLASTEIGTIFLDLELNVRRFTPAVTAIVNLIPADIGRPLAHIVHNLNYERLIADVEEVLDSLAAKTVQIQGRQGGWYSMRITLYRAANRVIEGAVITFVDITERKLAEEKFRGLLESSPDSMVITDAQGGIVLLNAQAERMFGYQRAELIGQKVEVLVPERSHAQHPGYRGHYMRNPQVKSMNNACCLSAVRKDGSEFPVEIALSPLETEEGTLVSCAVRDVSYRQRVEDTLHRLNTVYSSLCNWSKVRMPGIEEAGPLAELCVTLVQEAGYRCCWIGLTGSGKAAELEAVAQSGFSPEQESAPDLGWVGPAGRAEPTVMQNISTDHAQSALGAQAAAGGFESAIALPLMKGKKRAGLLLVYSATPRAFETQEVELLQTLTSNLSAWLQRGSWLAGACSEGDE